MATLISVSKEFPVEDKCRAVKLSAIPGNQFENNEGRDGEVTPMGEGEIAADERVTVVTSLTTGHRVIVIGTQHFSPSDANSVRRIIRGIRPICVGVELCPSRFRQLLAPLRNEPQQDTGGQSCAQAMGPAKTSTVKRKGLIGTLLPLLHSQACRLTLSSPGSEFRAAIAEVLCLHLHGEGTTLLLIDRPIDVTISRLRRLITFAEATRFVCALIKTTLALCWRSRQPLQPHQPHQPSQRVYVPQASPHDNVATTAHPVDSETSQCLRPTSPPAEALRHYDTVRRVLATERDVILAHNIAFMLSKYNLSVAVVGLSHVDGIRGILRTGLTDQPLEQLWSPTPMSTGTHSAYRYTIGSGAVFVGLITAVWLIAKHFR